MNALLRHVWGESAAADQVWEQVTGMRPALAVAQPIMVLQAFMDDSRSGRGNGIFVLGGCIARAEAWAQFAAKWEELLPLAPLDSKLKRNFKFSEFVSAGEERLQHLPAFAKVISDHIQCTIVFVMHVRELQHAQTRVQVPGTGIHFRHWSNPYLFAFLQCLGSFHHHRDKFPPLIEEDEEIRFIFDDQSEKSKILRAWEGYIDSITSDTIKERYRVPPRFEDDAVFLPLQAADLISGWCRYWIERGISPQKGRFTAYGRAIGPPSMKVIVIHMQEDMIVDFFMKEARRRTTKDQYVCDIQVGFSEVPKVPLLGPSLFSRKVS